MKKQLADVLALYNLLINSSDMSLTLDGFLASLEPVSEIDILHQLLNACEGCSNSSSGNVEESRTGIFKFFSEIRKLD